MPGRLPAAAVHVVVGLAGLIVRCRSNQDGIVDCAREVHTETMAGLVWHRIDQPVDERSARQREFGVLAAARIDFECFSAK